MVLFYKFADIDECVPAPCKNGATCVDLVIAWLDTGNNCETGDYRGATRCQGELQNISSVISETIITSLNYSTTAPNLRLLSWHCRMFRKTKIRKCASKVGFDIQNGILMPMNRFTLSDCLLSGFMRLTIKTTETNKLWIALLNLTK